MKTLVIGLDGATWSILDPLLNDGRLPNIADILDSGARGTLDSTRPPMTPLAWTSMATGVNPGKHGIYDFLTQDRDTYQVAPVEYSVHGRAAVWDAFESEGRRIGVVNYPLVHPPRSAGEFFISGIPASVEEGVATPPALQERIEAGDYRIHPARTHDDGLDNYYESILEQTDAQHRLTLELIEEHDLECLWTVFMGIDWAQHYLWNHKVDGENRMQLVYERLDKVVGELVAAAGDPTVILVSDHGMKPIDGEIYLNSVLEREGYLHRTEPDPRSTFERARDALLSVGWTVGRSLPPSIKYRLKGVLPTTTIDEMEEAVGYGRSDVAEQINWEKTTAFSYGYMGRVFLHTEDHYPLGTISQEEYERIRSDLVNDLLKLEDPNTGEAIVEDVLYREKVYEGEHMNEAPDLLVIPTDWRYMMYGDFGDAWYELPSDRIADHAPNGIIAVGGDDVTPCDLSANIVDLAPTLLAAHNLPIPEGMDGEPLTEPLTWVDKVSTVDNSYYDVSVTDNLDRQRDQVTDRLEDLGYL